MYRWTHGRQAKSVRGALIGLNKEPVTAVSKNKKSILDSSDDEDGEPSFSFLKTGIKKGIRVVQECQ